MFTICCHTILKVPRSNDLLVIPIKSKAKYGFHAGACWFTFYENLVSTEFAFFRRSVTIHHFRTLYKVALVSLPPHQFVRPPCFYYRQWKVKIYKFGLASNGVIFVPNLIETRPSVLELKHVDRRTDAINLICRRFVHIVHRTHNKTSLIDACRNSYCNIKADTYNTHHLFEIQREREGESY
jgi:hypothetical protein